MIRDILPTLGAEYAGEIDADAVEMLKANARPRVGRRMRT